MKKTNTFITPPAGAVNSGWSPSDCLPYCRLRKKKRMSRRRSALPGPNRNERKCCSRRRPLQKEKTMNEKMEPVRLAGEVLSQTFHVCAFFHSREEEYRVLMPFIKDG